MGQTSMYPYFGMNQDQTLLPTTMGQTTYPFNMGFTGYPHMSGFTGSAMPTFGGATTHPGFEGTSFGVYPHYNWSPTTVNTAKTGSGTEGTAAGTDGGQVVDTTEQMDRVELPSVASMSLVNNKLPVNPVQVGQMGQFSNKLPMYATYPMPWNYGNRLQNSYTWNAKYEDSKTQNKAA